LIVITIAYYNNTHSSAIWHQLAAVVRDEGIELLSFGFGGEGDFVELLDNGKVDVLLASVQPEAPGLQALLPRMMQVPIRIALHPGFPNHSQRILKLNCKPSESILVCCRRRISLTDYAELPAFRMSLGVQ